MSKTPIHIDSRAWTGDHSAAQAEFEVLGRRFDISEKRKRSRAWALAALILGGMLCLAIDLIIWLIDGSPTYLAPPNLGRTFFIALVTFGSALLLLLRLTNSWHLWPLAIVSAMVGGELAVSLRYLQDSEASTPVQKVTFAIETVRLDSGGRRWRSAKWRPEARLIDGRGRQWTIKGSRKSIALLRGQDCVSFSVRGANGGYQFVESASDIIETPYIDSIKGQRHLSRCFVPAAQAF